MVQSWSIIPNTITRSYEYYTHAAMNTMYTPIIWSVKACAKSLLYSCAMTTPSYRTVTLAVKEATAKAMKLISFPPVSTPIFQLLKSQMCNNHQPVAGLDLEGGGYFSGGIDTAEIMVLEFFPHLHIAGIKQLEIVSSLSPSFLYRDHLFLCSMAALFSSVCINTLLLNFLPKSKVYRSR